MATKAIIFDRDGTLNKTTQIKRAWQTKNDETDGYVLHPSELELLPNVREALAIVRTCDITPFVFTQQNSVGKGLISEKELEIIHEHMNDLLGEDAKIEKFYSAWNSPGTPDNPRAKPNPAMILEIQNDYKLDKKEVVVMGDSMRDYKAAVAADVAFIWIKDDLNRVGEDTMRATGCNIFDTILDAVIKITSPPTPPEHSSAKTLHR